MKDRLARCEVCDYNEGLGGSEYTEYEPGKVFVRPRYKLTNSPLMCTYCYQTIIETLGEFGEDEQLEEN